MEFQHLVAAGRSALPAINLCADIALMTAFGNDLGFRNVFVRQLIAHGQLGDSLIELSTSDNSQNIMVA